MTFCGDISLSSLFFLFFSMSIFPTLQDLSLFFFILLLLIKNRILKNTYKSYTGPVFVRYTNAQMDVSTSIGFLSTL
ncbi:hypothetical protein BDV29DRAFT_170221 [Aspergillus leporis]|uniref:Uncharacterized protein n=1 Tax=Aspergillus leporis TaxID=41062 RepID=A0A5N5X6Q7_9EURO|nr:hypothetical protein BDV29DRAFT_170221 [Aspergillus leporis]